MPHPADIEYFYSAHSAYAYLGAWELARIAQTTGARVIHRPFDFRPVVAAAGSQPVSERTTRHMDYFFGRELRRWATWRHLPILDFRPTFHDNSLALSNGAIIAAGAQADVLSRAILQAHWRDDADIADTAVIERLAHAAGLDGAAIVAAALSQDVQTKHQANTSEAIARGVFGSPSYFVGDDMFYGQDRLMMVERAVMTPFPP